MIYLKIQQINKERINKKKKWPKDINRYFTVKNTKMVNKNVKRFTRALATNEKQIKAQFDVILSPLEQQKLKSLTILNNIK